MRTWFGCLSLLVFAVVSGCTRQSAPAQDAGVAAAPAAPLRIEDVRIDDPQKLLSGTSWCERKRAIARHTFAADGSHAFTRGGTPEEGTWSVRDGKVMLSAPDAGTRELDVQAGRVNGELVLSLDGELYDACPMPKP